MVFSHDQELMIETPGTDSPQAFRSDCYLCVCFVLVHYMLQCVVYFIPQLICVLAIYMCLCLLASSPCVNTWILHFVFYCGGYVVPG